jgi:hypothetical protein
MIQSDKLEVVEKKGVVALSGTPKKLVNLLA